jgi:hypothetical protein
MLEIKDEILSGEPKYRFRDNNGNIIQDNVSIEQITPVIQEGTPVNKALVKGLQQEMLSDTKLLVAEYTSTEELKEIEIEGLDIEADGGVYDVIISGVSNSTGLRINGIADEAYSLDDSKGTYIPISISGKYGGVVNITLCKQDDEIFVNGICCSHVNYAYTIQNLKVIGGAVATDNLTSIQILNLDTTASQTLKAGFNIKIYKRR